MGCRRERNCTPAGGPPASLPPSLPPHLVTAVVDLHPRPQAAGIVTQRHHKGVLQQKSCAAGASAGRAGSQEGRRVPRPGQVAAARPGGHPCQHRLATTSIWPASGSRRRPAPADAHHSVVVQSAAAVRGRHLVAGQQGGSAWVRPAPGDRHAEPAHTRRFRWTPPQQHREPRHPGSVCAGAPPASEYAP